MIRVCVGSLLNRQSFYMLALLAGCCATVSNEAIATLGDLPFRQSYQLTQDEFPSSAVIQQSISVQQNGCLTVTKKSAIALFSINESEQFCAHHGTLKPTHYYFDGIGSHCREVIYDLPHLKALAIDKGNKKILDLPDNIFGLVSLFIQMGLDASDPLWRGDDYSAVSRLRVKTYSVERIGTEKVTVPGGRFDAVVVQGNAGTDEHIKAWFAPDFGGMLVQLVRQKKGKKKVLQLRDYSTRGVPARVLFDAGADTLSPQLIRGLDAVTPRCRR